MTIFRFAAVHPADGRRVRGKLDVGSREEAAATLGRRGLLPVSVEMETPGQHGPGLPLAAQATALRSLAVLVEAGVPVTTALGVVARACPPAAAAVLARAQNRVREGTPVWSSLDSENIFSPAAVGLVRSGESGAGLAAGLGHAADELERGADMAARLRAALAYPVVLAAVGVLSVLGILLFVVPRFATLLADVEQTLPLTTRLLLSASLVLREHGVLASLLLAATLVAANGLVSWRSEAWHARLLAMPLIGAIRHALATARAARTLGALLEIGTPALQALRIARETVGDAEVARRLGAASSRVSQGASFSRALAEERAFTPVAIELAAVGDGAGRLGHMLARAAELEQRQAEQKIRTAAALAEPALILMFAVAVAFVAAALLQAVYSIRPAVL